VIYKPASAAFYGLIANARALVSANPSGSLHGDLKDLAAIFRDCVREVAHRTAVLEGDENCFDIVDSEPGTVRLLRIAATPGDFREVEDLDRDYLLQVIDGSLNVRLFARSAGRDGVTLEAPTVSTIAKGCGLSLRAKNHAAHLFSDSSAILLAVGLNKMRERCFFASSASLGIAIEADELVRSRRVDYLNDVLKAASRRNGTERTEMSGEVPHGN
jgi:hypothetical protein